MEIETVASIHVPRPVETVFDFAVDSATFPRVLGPLGPIPGIARIEMIDPPGVGARLTTAGR